MTTSKKTNSSFGGLKIRNLKKIDINVFCELCKLLQHHPMQLQCCGIRLCEWCSKKGLSNSEPFICPFCKAKCPKKQLLVDRAVERDLNMIKIECYACSWNGSYQDYLEHLQQNHADLECSDCHERFFAINPYEEHRQEICEYRCIPCGLPGCMELIKRSEMQVHYLTAKHQKFLVEFIIQKKHSLDKTASNVVGNKIQGLKANCERNISQINETKKTFDANNEKFLACVQSQNESGKKLEHTNIYLLDNDDSMIFPFRKHSGEINSSFSMSSPAFRISTFGYSFELRVCSTMQDNRAYLSIYITLLRSDFDPILFYPFPYNISLCLCDQSGHGKDIVSIIKPDSNSSAFARPTSEKNNEIGITEFCPLNYLTDKKNIYLKDGVFFIRISFDFMHTRSNPVEQIIQ